MHNAEAMTISDGTKHLFDVCSRFLLRELTLIRDLIEQLAALDVLEADSGKLRAKIRARNPSLEDFEETDQALVASLTAFQQARGYEFHDL